MMDKKIVGTAQCVFGKTKVEEPAFADSKRRRMQLLSHRRDLREKLGKASDTEIEQCQQELKLATKVCQKHRQAVEKRRQASLREEMWEAWRGRRLAEANRISTLLCRSRYGPKKRYFRTLRGANPIAQEWLEAWQLPGAEGGMLCSRTQWDEIREQ